MYHIMLIIWDLMYDNVTCICVCLYQQVVRCHCCGKNKRWGARELTRREKSCWHYRAWWGKPSLRRGQLSRDLREVERWATRVAEEQHFRRREQPVWGLWGWSRTTESEWQWDCGQVKEGGDVGRWGPRSSRGQIRYSVNHWLFTVAIGTLF